MSDTYVLPAEHTLARAGRTRRDRLARDEHREDMLSLGVWNRVRELTSELHLDQRLSTQRGKLFYARQITAPEFEAGNRWADLLEGYDAIVLSKRRTPASPALERLGAGEGRELDPKKVANFRAKFDAAHKALCAGGKITETAASRLCRDEGTGAFLDEAIAGLRLLAEHFGLTKKRKSA